MSYKASIHFSFRKVLWLELTETSWLSQHLSLTLNVSIPTPIMYESYYNLKVELPKIYYTSACEMWTVW